MVYVPRDGTVDVGLGGAADIRMLPLTIRLAGEFDQVHPACTMFSSVVIRRRRRS